MLRTAITIRGSLALLAVGSVFLLLCESSSGMAVVQPRVNIQKYYTITNVPEIAPLGALVEQFLASRTANPHTFKAYKNSLKYFREMCDRKNVLQYADVNRQLIVDFLDERQALEAQSTARLRYDAMSVFCGWVHDRFFIFNPLGGVPRPIVDDDDEFKGLTEAEHLYLISNARKQVDPIRRFLPLLLVETGLRCFEAVGLKLGQLSDDRLWLRYVVGKGRKRRHVAISPELAPELQVFLAWRESLPAGKDAPLFPSPRGMTERTAKPLGRKTVWRIMDAVAKTNPHSARHTYGYRTMARLLKDYDAAGLSPSQALDRALRVTAKSMGHSSTATTMRYLQVQDEHYEQAFHGGLS